MMRDFYQIIDLGNSNESTLSISTTWQRQSMFPNAPPNFTALKRFLKQNKRYIQNQLAIELR